MVDAMLAVVLAVASAAPEAPPAAIPGAQLVRGAESAYAELRRIGDLAGPEAAVDGLLVPLSAMEREVDKLRSTGPAGLTTASEAEADYAFREVTRRQDLVRQWDDRLSARVQLIDAAAASLRRLIETWRLTIASLDAGTPPALVARANDVRNRALEMEGVVRKRLASDLELQDRIAGLSLALSVQLATQGAADAARRQELFDIESTPLWRVAAWTRTARSVGPLRLLVREIGATLSYAASAPVRTGAHLALAAALIATGLAVTRRLSLASPAPGRRPLSLEIVVRHPVESAILMAIFLTPLVHPARPPALDLIMSLAALVPVLRIARVLEPTWRRPVRWIAVLFVTERLIAFAPQAAIYARVALLVVAIAASAGFVVALRDRGRLSRIEAVGWRVAIVAGAGVAAILFAVSAVANVVGNVSLAKLLTGATLASMFAAAAAATLVAVISGAFRALLELPGARGLRVVRDHEDRLVRRMDTLLRLAGIAVWLGATLRAFQATQSFREVAAAALGLRIKVGGLDLAAGDVVAFAITLWIAVWLSRALRFVLDEAVFPVLDVQRGSAAAISATVSYAIVGLGFGAAVLAAGVEMTRFAVLAGTLGVGIGFGLQNVVNNFVSGLILLYEQPVQVGDIIEVGKLNGEVRRIGVRSSTVRTFQGADVVVPNSNFISAEVVNWTRSDRWRRVDISLGVAYGTDPARVIELLLEIAKACPAVTSAHAPTAFFTGLGDSALQFELRVWTSVDDWVATASTLRASIHEALPRAGIVLAFPQLDLWVRSVPQGSSGTPLVPGVAQLPSPGTSKAKLPPGQ